MENMISVTIKRDNRHYNITCKTKQVLNMGFLLESPVFV